MRSHKSFHVCALIVEDSAASSTGCGAAAGFKEREQPERGRLGRRSVPTLPSNASSRSRSRSARVASVGVRMGWRGSCPAPAPMHGAELWQTPMLTAAATLRDARGEQRRKALVELACAGIASEVVAHEVTH